MKKKKYRIHSLKQTLNSNTLIGHVINIFFFNLSLIVRCEKVKNILRCYVYIDEFYFLRKRKKKRNRKKIDPATRRI
jgi:hypothetical protein